MELNKVTQELLAAGYTEKETPPGMRPYNKWHGGWEYGPEMLRKMVLETPCGLLLHGYECTGSMGYMGIEWMQENDNPVICCPRFDVQDCEKNHPLLRNLMMSELRHGGIRECACHQTDRKYDYAHSVEKVRADNDAEADRLFQEFSAKRNGRACRQQCNYNRWTKQWSMSYDPMICTHSGCWYCAALKQELSTKKGNVFYDLRITRTEKGYGLFPDKPVISLTKGIKLLDKTVSMTICEAIAKCGKQHIYHKIQSRYHHQLFFDKMMTIAVENIRAERRETRDLMQDLSDAAEGIEITHAGDVIKAAAQQKRERRAISSERRMARLERLILANGFDGLEEVDQRRAEKVLGRERLDQLEIQRHESPPPSAKLEQISLF